MGSWRKEMLKTQGVGSKRGVEDSAHTTKDERNGRYQFCLAVSKSVVW